jgi:hypothetical protein
MFLHLGLLPQVFQSVVFEGQFLVCPEHMTRFVTGLTHFFGMIHFLSRKKLARPFVGMNRARNKMVFGKRCSKPAAKTAMPFMLLVHISLKPSLLKSLSEQTTTYPKKILQPRNNTSDKENSVLSPQHTVHLCSFPTRCI